MIDKIEFSKFLIKMTAMIMVAVIDSNGKTLAAFSGLTRNSAEFIAFLEKGKNYQ